MANSNTLRDSSRYMILTGITGGVLFLGWTTLEWLLTGMWQPAVIGDVPLWIGENVSACGHHEGWKNFFQAVCWFEGLWLWIALPVVGVTCGWLREQQ